jgi:hypothetical protein
MASNPLSNVLRAARGALAVALLAPSLVSMAAEPLGAEMVKPGLYRITGAASGTLLRLGPEGAIVVDSNSLATYRPLMAEIQRIARRADVPVHGLILTAVGPGQAANVASFVDAGVPVVLQRKAYARLAAPRSGADGSTPKPFVTYDIDHVVGVGDVRAEIQHVGHGRTGVDSIVYFRDLRVVAVGELFTHGVPQPDCASGGSYAGWAAAITHLLWVDFDVAVPSRGAPVGKQELMSFKAKLQALAERGSSPCSLGG